MIHSAHAQSHVHPAAVDRLVAALFAALLGSFIIFGVGFTTIPAVHNAAHDSRHSNAFPCH